MEWFKYGFPHAFNRAKPMSILETINDQYLTLKVLTEYSSIPYSTLRSYIAAGYFNAYKPAGTVLVKRSEFDAWVQKARIAPDIEAIVDKIKLLG